MTALAVEVLENPVEVSVLPKPGKQRTQFTPERAREMAKLAVAARIRNKAERERIAALPPPEPVKPDDNTLYVESRIVQTRKQIEALDKRLATCKEPKDLKFITDAIAKLAELERVLSGRPAPGQYRPVKGKSETRQDKRTLLQPLDAQSPEPIA
jgi:hypothetical protein